MAFGIIFIFLVIIFALISKINIENSYKNKEDRKRIDTKIYSNIEEQFFIDVNNGKEKIKYLKIDNQFDLMFIKSLFQSENIPFYIEFEHISRMRPGMYVGDLGNYNLLYILKEDYIIANEIVSEYIKKKFNVVSIEHNKNKERKEKVRNIFEILFGNWKVPSANDTHGIEILYKN